ncbi:precorrin-6A reductase [Thermincola potens]|uniref:precorrin-6A reductase n=1 Tax=Thermincola potens TaxID=863643 RepID=UPI00059F1CEF|nr:precorrin-6A reductase [Thermincola potens]
MILVLSGTKEGTQIISQLAVQGNEIYAVTVTAHGTKTASGIPGVKAVEPAILINNFYRFCADKKISVIIDATHPFPGNLSKMAKEVCQQQDLPYIRLVREETDLPDHPLINPVYSWEEAASKAAQFGDTIFLTTGSNNLEGFLENEHIKGKRVVVRVLPDWKVIQKCQNLGLTPKDIVAMQGPFSKEMNRQQFKMYNASVIITKDSGKAGGTDTKVSAALSLGLPVVVIKRERQKEKFEVTDYDSLYKLMQKLKLL